MFEPGQQYEIESMRCPFDQTHFMPRESFIRHLGRCKATNKSDFSQCPYDVYHVIKKPQFNLHCQFCPSRKKFQKFQQQNQCVWSDQEDNEQLLNDSLANLNDDAWDQDQDSKEMTEKLANLSLMEKQKQHSLKNFKNSQKREESSVSRLSYQSSHKEDYMKKVFKKKDAKVVMQNNPSFSYFVEKSKQSSINFNKDGAKKVQILASESRNQGKSAKSGWEMKKQGKKSRVEQKKYQEPEPKRQNYVKVQNQNYCAPTVNQPQPYPVYISLPISRSSPSPYQCQQQFQPYYYGNYMLPKGYMYNYSQYNQDFYMSSVSQRQNHKEGSQNCSNGQKHRKKANK